MTLPARPGKPVGMGTSFPVAGTYTAIVTPFQKDGRLSLDLRALDALVDAQLAAGIDGLVPCGTTGESPTLTGAEQLSVIRLVATRARGKAKVVAGTGTNATATTIERSKAAVDAGADAVMVVVPYYNKPTQDGLVEHFVAVAAAVPCPVIVYNIPGRTGVDLQPDSLGRILEAAKNVVATKESTGNVLRAQELVRRYGDRLAVMCGDDALTLPMMAVGARGVISVTSNLLPARVGQVVKAASEGRFAEALPLHLALLPVHEALFLESNPSPVKAALALLGQMTDAVRPPLTAANFVTRGALEATLATYRKGAA